jgi:hypothetical protein
MKVDAFLLRLSRWLWAAALVSLPVTSFRYFPFLGDGTVVRPLALYPAALLVVVSMLQIVRKKARFDWPPALLLLGLFVLFATMTTAIGALYAPLGFTGNEYGQRALRAWVTMAIGLTFFWSAMWMNRDESDLRFTLKWLFVGLVLNLLWSGVQTFALYTDYLHKNTVSSWQRLFSMRGMVGSKRISGFAYEPSWLTAQLNTIYIPWLFAAILVKYRLGAFRWLKYVLMLGALTLLVLAYSRGGLGTWLIATLLTFLLTGRQLMRDIWRWLRAPFRPGEAMPPFQRVRSLSLRLGILTGALALLLLSGYFLANSRYINALWSARSKNLVDFVIDNYAGSRLAYAWAAMETFQEYPFTGVGLGASGFYLFDRLPDWSFTSLYQTVWQLSPRGRFYLNPKNLYIRLLAETGIIGLTLFAGFYAYLLHHIRSFLRSRSFLRFIGVAGLFSWLAILITCLTQDSLAIPNLWLNPGILVGLSTGLALESTHQAPTKE